MTRAPYAYSGDSPLNRTHPTGLDDWYMDKMPWAGVTSGGFMMTNAAEFGLEGDREGYHDVATRTIARAMGGDLPVKPDPETGAYAAQNQMTGTFVKFRPGRHVDDLHEADRWGWAQVRERSE